MGRCMRSGRKSNPIRFIFTSGRSWAKTREYTKFHQKISKDETSTMDGHQMARRTDKHGNENNYESMVITISSPSRCHNRLHKRDVKLLK